MTSSINFINILQATFKCESVLYIFFCLQFSFVIFRHKIMVQKLHMKFWWNWLHWGLFHQHFLHTFFAIILLEKNTKSEWTRQKLREKLSYEKHARKMLMKLTAEVNFACSCCFAPFIFTNKSTPNITSKHNKNLQPT